MKAKKIVWIVQKYVGHWTSTKESVLRCSFEFIGVFETRSEARTACRNHLYMMGPAVMGKALPDRCVPWKGAHYPVNPPKRSAKAKRGKEICH